jgi:hypothetical protein
MPAAAAAPALSATGSPANQAALDDRYFEESSIRPGAAAAPAPAPAHVEAPRPGAAPLAALSALAADGSPTSRAALDDLYFEGSAIRPGAAAVPAPATVEPSHRGILGGIPLAELAEKASGFVSTAELPASRVFLGAEARLDPEKGGRVAEWRLSFAGHRDGTDRFKNKTTRVAVTVTADGAFVKKERARGGAGFFSSRKIEGLKFPGSELRAVLNNAAYEYPDMRVETVRFAEETDTSYYPAYMPFSNQDEQIDTSVPVWRLEGRSKENPDVRMSVSYDAASALVREQRTTIEGAPSTAPEELPGATPVWATWATTSDAPYPTPEKVLARKINGIASRYGVERWVELEIAGSRMYGYRVYRLKMTAARYADLRRDKGVAKLEYAIPGAR